MAHAFGNERVASLLPPVYVAVVERAQIVPDLFDVVEHFESQVPSDLPSNLTFITGPSKTGDIESKLVTGVHGPGKWHVIVIDCD
jgi:L-lactate dehydrogenase complex protein LldG